MEISNIHDELFQYLISIHNEHRDFKFGVRKINRGLKLEKGYWFLGNENYLSIPFWKGTDERSKAPMITFIVHKDGSTKFEVNDSNYILYDSGATEQIIKELNLSIPFTNNIKIERKNYGNEYLKSLKDFIRHEKIIIDQVLEKYLINIEDEYLEEIDFITDKEFKASIKNIEEYRKSAKSEKLRKGTIKNISISNFHNIASLKIKEIPENCKWVFITGENGSGKTTLLQSLAIGICRNLDEENVLIQNKNSKIQLSLHNGVKYPSPEPIDKNISSSNFLTKGFATYGPIRLFSESSKINGIKFDEKIASRLTFGLFNSITLLQDLGGDYLFAKPKYHEMAFEDFLDNISINLPLIVPGVTKVEFYKDENKNTSIIYYQANSPLNLDKTAKTFKFNELSSGTKNFAGIILDLLLKLKLQQPEIIDIANFTGIVLIDEIDLHLHPKMQKEIVSQLSQTFPNIQFIVTTHSPIPLLGAPKGSIFIKMDKDDKYNISAEILDIDIENLLPNTILTSPIFGFDEIINDEHKFGEKIYKEVDYSEVVFLKVLENKLNEGLPEYLKTT